MVDLPIAFAFSAGLVAAFNPCGFALLPLYMSRFLGTQTTSLPPARRLGRAVGVAGVVSTGFLLVFGVVGLVFSRVSLAVADYFPWLTVVVGFALVAVGVAMLAGHHPNISLPRVQRGGSGSGLGSMMLFGVSYGTVSLSCTLPIFLAAVSSTFVDASVGGGLAVFAAYGLGMGMVLVSLTVALALSQEGVVRRMRRVMPRVNSLSAVLMLVAGLYVTYYGYYSIRVNRGEQVGAGPVGVVTDLSARISNAVNDFGAMRLGWSLAAFLVLAGAMVAFRTGASSREKAEEKV